MVLLAALVAATGLMVVPSAEAQIEQCSTADAASITNAPPEVPTKPIRPIIGTEEIKIKMEYFSQKGTSITPVPITLSVKADDSWVVPVISPEKFFVNFEANKQGAKVPIDVKVTLAVTRDAPAFKPTKITVTATGEPGTCVGAPSPVTVTSQITAGFYERTQARFEKTVFKTGQNSGVAIPLTIENFGNGPIQVRFAKNDDSSKALVMALPGLQTVPSTIGGGETNKLSLNIDVQTPFKNGYENRKDQLLIDLTGNSADDPTIALTPLQVSAVIQTQGVYVPGFEAVTMLAALLGAIMATRRLRQ